jgi:hypothetical protein
MSIAACEGREEKSLMMDGTSVTMIRDTSGLILPEHGGEVNRGGLGAGSGV